MSQDISNEISRRGCFVSLSVSCWGARKKLAADAVDMGEQADPSMFGHAMQLIDKRALKPIRSISTEGHAAIKSRALPFDVGVDFVPNQLVAGLIDDLDRMRVRFDAAVAQFMAEYKAHIDNARAKLGDHFDAAAYPDLTDMRSKFKWAVRVVSMESPRHMQDIDPRLFRQVQQQFQAEMAEFSTSATAVLRERFVSLVQHLADRMTPGPDGKARIFHDSTVAQVQQFLADFGALNIANDETLAAQVDRMKALVGGRKPDEFRGTGDFQSQVAGALAGAAEAIGGMLVDRKRKIVLPGKPTEGAA